MGCFSILIIIFLTFLIAAAAQVITGSPWVGVGLVLILIWMYTKEGKSRKEKADLRLSNNFSNLSGVEFEEFIEDLFKKMGYNTKLTPQSQDYGLDLIAEKENEVVGVQCKRWQEKNVGPKQVREVLGAMHNFKRVTRTIIITTSDFTAQAREESEGVPIELWDKRILHRKVKKYF